ncbi:MAG: beta-galactosidase [Lentisphaeria bacterium]|nr:beta-galactosidase [Lentisphaeria bacterium]
METIRIDLPEIGRIKVRNVSETQCRHWTLGCETLDRDYADYDEYKEYLAPLGLVKIRLQGGWAKCEKVPGVYDFAWLDHIIDDARSRGLEIMLETDYGNPLYPGGGGLDPQRRVQLAGAAPVAPPAKNGLPRSPEGLAAWDNWVRAMAEHFRDRVFEWAMWNEPDTNKETTAQEIVDFNIRTAEIILSVIPNARIAGLSMASHQPTALYKYADLLKKAGKAELFASFIYHGYTVNPDNCADSLRGMKRVLEELKIDVRLRDGEAGCPSEYMTVFALRELPWTEFSQCKWDLRRYIGDFGNGVESSVFTICDFNHVGKGINRKGLLYADADHRVVREKPAYRAIQHMASLFDGETRLIPECGAAVLAEKPAFAFRAERQGGLMGVWWDSSTAPAENNLPEKADLMLTGEIREPAVCELISGRVFAFPEERILRLPGRMLFKDVPLIDSPLALAEKSCIPM